MIPRLTCLQLISYNKKTLLLLVFWPYVSSQFWILCQEEPGANGWRKNSSHSQKLRPVHVTLISSILFWKVDPELIKCHAEARAVPLCLCFPPFLLPQSFVCYNCITHLFLLCWGFKDTFISQLKSEVLLCVLRSSISNNDLPLICPVT